MRNTKRRHRQIGRLIYYYCCVRYLTRESKHGRWVKAMSDDGHWLGEWKREKHEKKC